MMDQGLWAKKSITVLLNREKGRNDGLKKVLGPLNLIAMGIGAIIGAGFFVLSGSAAAEYAGPGVILSFLVAATICIFSALCYAEFVSVIPIAGSAYSYAYVTLGEFCAWIIGWILIIEYICAPSTVAVGWSGYFVSILQDCGVALPTRLCQAPFAYSVVDGWSLTGSYGNLPAMIIPALVGYLICIGVRTAAVINNLLVLIKLLVIVLFIACGIAYIKVDHLIPLIPENTGIFGQFGWSGVLRGAGLVFFAFIGFDAVSTLAQEARNPRRDMPIGMLGSLSLSAVVYVITAVVLLGVVNYTQLGVADPLAVAVNALGPKFVWLRYIVKIGVLFGLTSVVLVFLLAAARVLFAMSHDGLLPKIFGKVHPWWNTPVFTSVAVTSIVVLLAGFFPLGIIGQLTSIGTMLVFAIVCLGVLVLRHTQPGLHRPFRTPWVPLVPVLGILTSLGQMFIMPLVTWVQLIVWMAVGLLVYRCYGLRHSTVRHPHLKRN